MANLDLEPLFVGNWPLKQIPEVFIILDYNTP